MVGDDAQDLPGLFAGQRRIGRQQPGRVGERDIEGGGGLGAFDEHLVHAAPRLLGRA